MPQKNTQSLLRFKNAFAQLLIDRPLDRITVQDVVRTAEVNRSTFYRHFLDLDDFLDWLADNMLEEITQQFTITDQDLDFTGFYQYAMANQTLLEAFLGTQRWTSLVTQLQSFVTKRYTALLQQQASSIPPTIQATFLIGGHIALFNWRMQQPTRPSPSQMAQYHRALSQPR